MKTTLPKVNESDRKWYIVDAAGKPAGRMAAEIAKILRGKNKVTFAPHLDLGDFVLVINAEKVAFSGSKEDKKTYFKHTEYPGGGSHTPVRTIRARHPERLVISAVKGMLPRNRMGRKIMGRLKVYAGSEHPHEAQLPQPLDI
ncbi:MAG: large subunit ribosomal protein L13 [Verrucomicrobiales bacterium]|jgi:large subunit ribosomal protein L13